MGVKKRGHKGHASGWEGIKETGICSQFSEMVKTEKGRGKVQLFFKKKKWSGRRKITRTIVQERVCRPGRIMQEKGRQQGKEGRLQQEQSLCASFFPPIRKRPMFQPRSTRTCLVLSKSPNLSELKSGTGCPPKFLIEAVRSLLLESP